MGASQSRVSTIRASGLRGSGRIRLVGTVLVEVDYIRTDYLVVEGGTFGPVGNVKALPLKTRAPQRAAGGASAPLQIKSKIKRSRYAGAETPICCFSSFFRILPVAPFGSEFTKRIERGYL